MVEGESFLGPCKGGEEGGGGGGAKIDYLIAGSGGFGVLRSRK